MLNSDYSLLRGSKGHLESFTSMSPVPVRKGLRDLGLEQDLCRSLRDLSLIIKTPKKGAEDTCLGYLTAANGLHFLFFYSARPSPGHGSHSLHDMLSQADSELGGPSPEARFQMASHLAAMTLYLHSSPWLSSAWTSRDIYLSHSVESDKVYMLDIPCVQIRWGKLVNQRSIPGPETSLSTSSLLWTLGTLLIEVAFAASLWQLELTEDITQDLSGHERQYLTVMRLSKIVSRKLGSRYAKVVRFCLSQDFEDQRLADVEELELNAVICQNIVEELDRCLSVVRGNKGV